MATTVVPALIDAIVAFATEALPDLIVYDGLGASDDPGDFLMVGVSDPEIESADTGADAQQDWATVGRQGARSEQGEVTCVALSWNGGSGNAAQKQARDAAYATVAAVEDFCRDDPTLEVPTLLWNSALTSHSLLQNQDELGTLAMVTFRIAFQARI